MKRLKKVLPVLLLLAGFALYYYDTQFATDEDFVPNTADPRIAYFQEQLPYRIVKAAEADINRDGRKDLVLIWYVEEEDFNHIGAVMNTKSGYVLTEASKAPYENITIEFKDIDEQGDLEFIVSGSREGRYGFGIYRMENDIVQDIFGENLEDC